MGRTVYCRWCYNKGHNKRTCPEYTETYKERAEAEFEDNKEFKKERRSTWRQEEYAKRIKADTLLNGDPFDRVKQGNGVGTRRCSYCAITGHNRRTCEKFGVAKQDYLNDAVAYRKLIAKTISKQGIGIGTLVTIQPRYGAGDFARNHLYMIIDFEWDSITHKTGTDGYRAIQVKALDVDEDGKPCRNEYIPFPKPHNHKDDPDQEDWRQEYANADKYWDQIKIVSTIPSKIVDTIIPSNWYKSKNIEKSDNFKNYFKDIRDPDYWDNHYS
jgi:hypothetical protein